MQKQRIITDKAPTSPNPTSQGMRCGDFVFTGGFTAKDPKTGELVPGGIEAQTRRVVENLRMVLEAGGSSLDKVVKVNAFLTNIADKPVFDRVYRDYFSQDPPGRVCVAVSDIEPGALIEMDAIGHV